MIKEFFYFQPSDRKVILTIVGIIVVGVVATVVLGGYDKTPISCVQDSLKQQKSPISSEKNRSAAQYYSVGETAVKPFPFDPNTADSTQLLRLGLKPWQVRNIYKYRANGGIYRKPSDFARLYGLTIKQYKALEPYIRISSDYLPAAILVADEPKYERDTVRYPVKIGPSERVMLNTADTSLLKKVPGIGSGFARAIVGYRARLGGYYAVEQLKEINGFPEVALSYFELGNAAVVKININKLTLNQLRRHPYINFYQAKAIVDFRRLHGNIKSLSDVSLSGEFTAADIQRLAHYVEF